MTTLPMIYTHFGYEFGEINNDGQLHPGVDLNRGSPNEDYGDDCKAMASGIVVYSGDTNGGFGKMIILYHEHLNVWTRYGHLSDIHVPEGLSVDMGDVIGLVGSSGGDWSAHLHFDVIVKELDNWSDYTTGMSYSDLLEYYTDPLDFIDEHDTSPEEERSLSLVVRLNSANWKRLRRQHDEMSPLYLEALEGLEASNDAIRKLLL